MRDSNSGSSESAQSVVTRRGEPVSAMIDLSRYPISNLSDAASVTFADQCRQQYEQTGLCMLPDFIVPDALALLSAEAESFSDRAYFCKSTHNAYLNDGDSSADKSDAANRQEQTFVGSVAYDHIPDRSLLKQLYQWDPLVGRILDGDRTGVVDLPFTAGTLLIFGGNQTLHRVTRVSGSRARLVPVLCYAEEPDLVNSESVRELFWGRSGAQNPGG